MAIEAGSFGPWEDAGGSYSQDSFQNSQLGNVGPISWSNFINSYNQIAAANQQQQQMPSFWQSPQVFQQQQQREEEPEYRQMTSFERFIKGAQDASDFLGSAVGDALFGKVPEGESPYSFNDIPGSVLRLGANLPGMIVGTIPDIVGYGGEFLTGTPVREADAESGMIEDRKLTSEEQAGNLGYTALSALSFIPGVGVVGKAGGTAMKGVGAIAKKAGAEAVGGAISKAGQVGVRGTAGKGLIETVGENLGKKGAQLNPYRWGDAALESFGTMAEEGLQEAGQTAFEDMRQRQFNEKTGERMLEAGIWGAIGGGIAGTPLTVGSVALENSRAKRGLDKTGKPLVSPGKAGDRGWFDYYNNMDEPEAADLLPENLKWILEHDGNDADKYRTGSSVKGVTGKLGQNMLTTNLPIEAARAQWNADKNGVGRSDLANAFGISVEDLGRIMDNDNVTAARLLGDIAKAAFESGDPTKFVHTMQTRFPSTADESSMVLFVTDVTVGNTTSTAPGVSNKQGGDYDGDLYTKHFDKTMRDWDYLPTRHMMTASPVIQYVNDNKETISYGKPTFGFESAGITGDFAAGGNGAAFMDIRNVLLAYGLDEKTIDDIEKRIRDAFKISEQERKHGVTFEHKLSKVFDDIIRERPASSETNALVNDMLVSDLVSSMSRSGSLMRTLNEAQQAYGIDGEAFDSSLGSTIDEIPISKGDMPTGKVAAVQIMEWWGRFIYPISEKENPMFRFKQMGAWNEKHVHMLADFCSVVFPDIDNVDAAVKWAMQITNDMHLPIDYIETAFKAKVLSEVMSELGMNGSDITAKIGKGITVDQMKDVVTRVWNRNAEMFDEAVSKYVTNDGTEKIDRAFSKSRIIDDQESSFYRAVDDLFGSWSASQVVEGAPAYKTLHGWIEELESNPYNFNRSMLPHIDGADDFLNGLRDDYQGRLVSQLSYIKSGLDTELETEITVDEATGKVDWDARGNLEMGFFVGLINNALGLDCAIYLGIPGVKWFKNSPWARWLVSNDRKTRFRTVIAMRTAYNWRQVVDAIKDGRSPEEVEFAIAQTVDMTNPLNMFIYGMMHPIISYDENMNPVYGFTDAPLKNITDPSKISFDELSNMFETYSPYRVRANSDMMLYYALQDSTSTIDASDIGTRGRVVKSYQKAIEDNTIGKAQEVYEDFKSLMNGYSMEQQAQVVSALRQLSMLPDEVDYNAYSAGIHDAAYISGNAAEKAKAGRGVSLNAQSMQYVDGAYTSSFLSQLGSSLGSIPSDVAKELHTALKRAVFDPTYYAEISLGDGTYIPISQDLIFEEVGRKIGPDGVKWIDLACLFDKAPQVLMYLMPQRVEPLSPDADTVTYAMVDTPKKLVKNILDHNEAADIKKRNIKRIKAAIANDQDSPLVVLGYIDQDYDTALADSQKWSEMSEDALDKWAEFFYDLSCVQDPVRRQAIIDAEFGKRTTTDVDRVSSYLESLIERIQDLSNSELSKSDALETANRIAEDRFNDRVDKFLNTKTKQESDSSYKRADKDAVDSLIKTMKEAIETAAELFRMGAEVALDVEAGLIHGKVSNKTFNNAVKRVMDERNVDRDTARTICMGLLSRGVVDSSKTSAVLISREEGNPNTSQDSSPDGLINKVRSFVKSGNYKRLSSDFGDLDEWEKQVRSNWAIAKKSNDELKKDESIEGSLAFIHNQVVKWNNEIITAELQNISDLYGVKLSADRYKRYGDAKQFVEDFVEEISEQDDIEKVQTSLDPNNIRMPRMTFDNPATSNHIELASIELETGLAPISSGQNAGSYQYLAVLDLIGKDYRCAAQPRYGLTREEAIDLIHEQHGAPLNVYYPYNGHIGEVDEDTLMNESVYSDPSFVAELGFAPKKDCSCGICSLHNSLPVAGAQKDFLGGRYTIASLCWYLSEKRVFKSKKKRRVFEKISHVVRTANELKQRRFFGRDRVSLLQEMQQYQVDVGNHINQVFIDEQMDGEFGPNDALVIAQFTTPMIEVSFRVKNPETGKDEIEYITVSKEALYDDTKYNEAFEGIASDSIVMVKPINMSLIDVCKKLSKDVVERLSARTQFDNGELPSLTEMNGLVSESFGGWSGMRRRKGSLIEHLQGLPVVRTGSNRSVLFGSSPNAMQRFLELTMSGQRGSVKTKEDNIKQAFEFSEEDRAIVSAVNEHIVMRGNPIINGNAIVIVKSVAGSPLGFESNRKKMRDSDSSFSDLGRISKNFRAPNALNAVVMPDLSSVADPESLANKEYDEAKDLQRIILVPKSSAELFESYVSSALLVKVEGDALHVTNKRTRFNEDYYIYMPVMESGTLPDSFHPKTYIRPFYPEEMGYDWADFSLLATDDSGFKWSIRYASQKMPFESEMTFDKGVLSGDAKKIGSRLKKAITDSTFYIKKVDTDSRVEIQGELEKAANGETSRFIFPFFDKQYQVKDDIVKKSVEKYLKLDDSDLYESSIVNGSVNGMDCMGIVSVMVDKVEYYMPLIFNTGGTTTRLDNVYMTDSDLRKGDVKMYWNGNLTPTEAGGLKVIFPTLAYKAYSTVGDKEEQSLMLEPLYAVSIEDPRHPGTRFEVGTRGYYSASTEDGRFVDMGYASKVETLGNLGKIVPRNFFMKKDEDTGQWVVDYEKFQGLGLTRLDIEEIATNPFNFGIWNRFVLGLFRLSNDPEVNAAMQKVAKACLASGMNPWYAFCNIKMIPTRDASGKVINDGTYVGLHQLVDFNEQLIYGSLFDNELEMFFYAMDHRFCYNGSKDMPHVGRTDPLPMVNHDGMILAEDKMYHRGHVHFLHPTDDSAQLGMPSGKAKYGSQQVINMALVYGLHNARDISIVNDYIHHRAGDPSSYTIGGKNVSSIFDGDNEDEIKQKIASRGARWYENVVLRGNGMFSYKEIDRRNKLLAEQRNNLDKLMTITSDDKDGGALDFSKDTTDTARYKNAISKFQGAFPMPQGQPPLSIKEIHKLFKETTASTYNGGKGSRSVTISQFCDWIDMVVGNVEHGEFPFDSELDINGRPILPYIDKQLAERLMQSDAMKHLGGQDWTYQMFVDKMEDMLDASLDYIQENNNDVIESVLTMVDYIAGTYGKPWMSRPLNQYGVHLSDLIDAQNPLIDGLEQSGYEPQLREARKRTRETVKAVIKDNHESKYNKVDSSSYPTGRIAMRKKAKNSGKFNTALNSMVSVSQAMALANPALPVSAIALRAKGQGLTKAYLFLGRILPNGLWGGNDGISLKNREAVKAAANNPLVIKIWEALYVLGWSGEDILALQNAGDAAAMEKMIDDRRANMTRAEKAKSYMFRLASGGSVGMSWQIENFLDRFALTTNNDTAPWLMRKDATGLTVLEQMVEQNPAQLVIDLLTTNSDNPDFMRANGARNFVLRAEHANQSLTGLVMTDLFSRSPIGKFIFQTGFCRFPHYAMNVGGWFVRHVAPVCTITHVFRKLAADAAQNGTGKISNYLKTLGVERVQTELDIREAILMDTLTIGSTLVAGALFGLGAFEPPDDEYYDELAGNPDEWTICGLRVAENWWLMDILGPFAAVCATWKSIEIGKPRFDIFQNWMSQALWSNPVMKASDIARSLLDPTEQYLEEYDNIVDQYQNIEGGAPDMLESWLDDKVSFGLNWFGQFVTPSFVREVGNSREFMKYERSYKKVVNEKGELEYTDYLDSQIRKVTRKNPVLGLILNVANAATGFNDSQTGYVATQMPEVLIPDQNQIDSINYFSMYNADGSEKTEAEKQYIAFQVLAVLNSTNDLDALYDSGFVLSNETRIYASQMLNDMRQYEQDQYDAWVQETGTDAYYVGNGDFAEGKRRINAIQSAFYDDIRDINTLFNKLWSDEMSRGIQMYYREATTYNQTTSGEYYATGYRRSVLPLPVLTAPGTYESPMFGTQDDGTMGRSGNWETPSAVVEGVSAGGRALVPLPEAKAEHPKLSDFADKDNGGYSDTEAGKMYAEASKNAKSASPSTGTASSRNSSTYGSSGGGGRGGSGGGGGYSRGSGSYAPNTYAPSINLPTARPSRIMNTDRVVRPDYQYLRPDFETKGSREAYRRSDI